MKYRKLRIAWSVMWGVAAVMLIALWVQSYWTQYRIICPAPGQEMIEVDTAAGVVWFQKSRLLSGIPWKQSLYQFKLDDPYLAFVNGLRQKTFVGFARIDDITFLGTVRINVFPYWFPVLLFAAVAYMPWFPWSNRFSLRTLLIATTFVAVVLGLVAYGATK